MIKKIFSIFFFATTFICAAHSNCNWSKPDWPKYGMPNPAYLLWNGGYILLCNPDNLQTEYDCKLNTIAYGTCNFTNRNYPIPIFYICTGNGWLPYRDFGDCDHDCSGKYKIVTGIDNTEICYIENADGSVGELCYRKYRQATNCKDAEYWDGYKCVLKKDLCDKSGGTWRNGQCLCSGDLTNDTSGCSCRCRCNKTGYTYNHNTKQCIEKKSQNSDTGGNCPGGCGNDIDITNNNQNNFNPTINITVGGTTCSTGNCPNSNASIVNNMQNPEDDIDIIYQRLSGIISSIKQDISVWRDAEGNFNTARLTSDSIAGVVLGTVGGIITANIVKKSQIKQGFEDMKCSIGGQSVASFGDDFTVGR